MIFAAMILVSNPVTAQGLMTKAEAETWLSKGRVIDYSRTNGQEVRLTFRRDGSLEAFNPKANRRTLGHWKIDEYLGFGRICQIYDDNSSFCSYLAGASEQSVILVWVSQSPGTVAALR